MSTQTFKAQNCQYTLLKAGLVTGNKQPATKDGTQISTYPTTFGTF